MELLYLKYFYELAGGASFSDTSEKFNISESALSKSIIKLESELNCTLFDRKVRPMRLTASGGVLKEKLDILIPLYNDIVDSLNDKKTQIRYCIIRNLDSHVYSSFFKKYMAEHKDVNIYATSDNGYNASPINFVNEISGDKVDFAIMHDSIFVPPHIKKFILKRDFVEVVVPMSNPLSEYNSLTTEQLVGQSIIGPGCTQDICAELAFTSGIRLPSSLRGVGASEAVNIFTECAQGNHISLYYASDIAGYNLSHYALRTIPLADIPRAPIIFMYRDESNINYLLESIAQDLREFLSSQPSAGNS